MAVERSDYPEVDPGMRLVIALDGIDVSEHFGRCPEYAVYDIVDDEITSRTIISNPGHQSDFLPRYLAAMDARCVVAGGIGEDALKLLEELGITAITGVQGRAEQVAADFVAGRLVSSENLCKRIKGECACQLL